MTSTRALNLAAAAYGWLAVLMSVIHTAPALRGAVVFTFALTCPGLPIVSRLHHREPLERAVFAVGLSICLSTVVAETMALAGRWSPAGGMAVLAAITTVGALLPEGGRAVAAPEQTAEHELSQSASADPRSQKGG
jgi:hypothetical protein